MEVLIRVKLMMYNHWKAKVFWPTGQRDHCSDQGQQKGGSYLQVVGQGFRTEGDHMPAIAIMDDICDTSQSPGILLPQRRGMRGNQLMRKQIFRPSRTAYID